MKSNFGAEHGTGLHWVLECYANGIREKEEDGTKLTKKQIKEYLHWRENVEDVWRPNPKFKEGKEFNLLNLVKKDEDPDKLKIESFNLIEEYLARQSSIYVPEKILGVESEFNIDLGEVDMLGTKMLAKGFMDFVYKINDDSIEMIDYKFGKKTQTYDEVYSDYQSKIYSMALRQLYPGYKNYYLTFDYMRGKPISVCYTDDDGVATKKDLIEKWKQIVRPQVITRNIGWHCNALCDKKLCDREWPLFQNKFGGK